MFKFKIKTVDFIKHRLVVWDVGKNVKNHQQQLHTKAISIPNAVTRLVKSYKYRRNKI